MKYRCLNPQCKKWPIYGGRGIRICARWLEYRNFLFDMGARPPGMTIERKNNDGDYEPGNCIWADAKAQANNRSISKSVTICGRRMTFRAACDAFGVSYGTLGAYAQRGRASYTETFYALLDRKMTGQVAYPGLRKAGRMLI